MSTTAWVPVDQIIEMVDPGILKNIAYGAIALFAAVAAVSAAVALVKLIQNRIKNTPTQKASRNPEGNPLLSKRMIAPLSLIAFNIILGWQNLHRFAAEDMGVGDILGHLLIFIFSGMVLWSGYERFQYSRQNQSVPRLTILLWTSISIESLVHFASSFTNGQVHGIGPIALALLPWGGGVVFELALGLNKSDRRRADDDAGNRSIPSSLKRNPLFYWKVMGTKAENPTWNAKEIINHVRSVRAADAAAAYERILSLPGWLQPLAGRGAADRRLQRRLIDLNPTGRPPSDPREALVNVLMVRYATVDVSTARGNSDAVRTALGGNPVPVPGEGDAAEAAPAVAPSDETPPALEASQSSGDRGEGVSPEYADEIDEFLSQTLGTTEATTEPPASDTTETPVAPEVPEPESDTGNTKRQSDSSKGATPKKRKVRQARTGATKKGATRTGVSTEARIAAVADLMRQRRDAGKPGPTVTDAAEHLSDVEGKDVARGTVYRYMKKAEEKLASDA